MDQAAGAWLLGQVRQSIDLYHRVLELDPSRARAVLNLGNLYYDVLGGGTEEGRREFWPKARSAYRYYLQMNQAEGLYDLFDQKFAVPYRLKEIAVLLGPPGERQPTMADF